MKTYYVLFKKNKKPVCGCWRRAESKEDAIYKSEMALVCKHPYIKFDYEDTEITDIKD